MPRALVVAAIIAAGFAVWFRRAWVRAWDLDRETWAMYDARHHATESSWD